MAVATSSSPRPFSLFQTSAYTQPSSLDQLTPLRRPQSPVTSHYRPYSIHISEASTSPRRRSIIRSPSLANMGFSFMDRTREKEKGKEKEKDFAKTLKPSSRRLELPLRAVTPPPLLPKHATDKPSTSSGLLTLPKERGLKKKRSLSSLLTAASEISHSTSTFPSRSGSLSPVYLPSLLGTSDSSQLSLLDETIAAKNDATITAQGEEKRRPRRRPANNFVRKNTWLNRQNMKVHPYPLEAIYMQAYETLQLENDRYTDILLRRLNPLVSPSFHNYGRKIPLYALDLGCGSGHWLLEASNTWKTSQITGFDLVDTLIPEVLGQDNVQFVRGNFLVYPLPFADKSFDLVRMANLSLCIPYDKWELVFSEVQRVLTVDGRLELIDDQIFFPYGRSPAMPPSSTLVSIPSTPMKHDGEVSWFDDDEDTLADDSMGDGDSMETDSTLISDADHSSLSLDEPKRNLVSVLCDTTPLQRPLPMPPIPLSPNDPDTPSPEDGFAETDVPLTARPSPWSREVEASRDMETVFQNMLNHKFRIHTRPSDFVVDMMKHVFGNGRKLRSFHLKLAPTDLYTNFGNVSNLSGGGSAEGGSDKDEKTNRINAKVTAQKIAEMSKPWFTVEWDNDEKKRLKRERKLGKLDAYRRVAEEGSRPHTPDVSIPEGISAKAAGRLGISENTFKRPEKVNEMPPERLGILGTRARKVSDCRGAPPPIPEEVAELSTDGESTDPVLSVDSRLWGKAGSRLSISHSTVNTPTTTSARERRPQSSSSSLSTTSATSQSPGLLIWPATFLPISPFELEMHACKHVHTLLGCKPALVEFIETYIDEHGARLASDEEFHQAIWDYECFRRRRFHWPSEIPEWDQDTLDESWDAVFTSKPGSISTSKPATSRTSTGSSTEVSSTSPIDISASSTHPYTVDELSHLRTIRIFEAVKTSEYTLASLQFPRRPPPIPLSNA